MDQAITTGTIAVIIPFYNGSNFIARALDSVQCQTVQPDEIIVVDDGSQPQEHALLQALLREQQYAVRLLVKENGGQGSARNAGVKACHSDYVCFLDQDDFFLERHIEVLKKSIPANDLRFGFVYGDLYRADGDGHVLEHGFIGSRAEHPKKSVYHMLKADMFILPSASLISRAAYLAVDGFDVQFTGYEDDDLFIRLFRAGYSNYFIEDCVTVWCIHIGSTSHSVRMCRSRWRFLRKMAEMFPDVPQMKLYYFRELLYPRFAPVVMRDAFFAKLEGSADYPELRNIFHEFVALVQSSPAMGATQKFLMRLAVHLLDWSPSWLIRLMREVVSRLRRWFIRR